MAVIITESSTKCKIIFANPLSIFLWYLFSIHFRYKPMQFQGILELVQFQYDSNIDECFMMTDFGFEDTPHNYATFLINFYSKCGGFL